MLLDGGSFKFVFLWTLAVFVGIIPDVLDFGKIFRLFNEFAMMVNNHPEVLVYIWNEYFNFCLVEQKGFFDEGRLAASASIEGIEDYI